MPVSFEAAHAARQLLGHVPDPMHRASFRSIFGHSLAAAGYFEEAISVIDDQLADAERARLEFVIPYCLASRAIVHTGMREYVLAEEELDEAEHLSADDQAIKPRITSRGQFGTVCTSLRERLILPFRVS